MLNSCETLNGPKNGRTLPFTSTFNYSVEMSMLLMLVKEFVPPNLPLKLGNFDSGRRIRLMFLFLWFNPAILFAGSHWVPIL